MDHEQFLNHTNFNLHFELKTKDYILQLIDEGEHEHQDFKYQISDAKKIARSTAYFAIEYTTKYGNIIGFSRKS